MATSLCASCSNWMAPEAYGAMNECAWLVPAAPNVTECHLYQYEPGSDVECEPAKVEW